MSIPGKIKEKVRDKTRDELTVHLRTLGVSAEMVEKGAPEDIRGKRFGEVDLGSIRLGGGEIDVVQINRWSSGGDDYEIYYNITFAVQVVAEARRQDMKAHTKWKTKAMNIPLFGGQVLDVEWSGGEIANLLNEETSMRQALLEEARQKKLTEVTIEPDKEKPYVRICVSGVDKKNVKISRSLFDCCNIMAGHIRKSLTTGASPAETSAKFCMKCGSRLAIEADYCTSCGTKQSD